MKQKRLKKHINDLKMCIISLKVATATDNHEMLENWIKTLLAVATKMVKEVEC